MVSHWRSVFFLNTGLKPQVSLYNETSGVLTYCNCFLNSKWRSRMFLTVQIWEEHGVDERRFTQARLSYNKTSIQVVINKSLRMGVARALYHIVIYWLYGYFGYMMCMYRCCIIYFSYMILQKIYFCLNLWNIVIKIPKFLWNLWTYQVFCILSTSNSMPTRGQ